MEKQEKRRRIRNIYTQLAREIPKIFSAGVKPVPENLQADCKQDIPRARSTLSCKPTRIVSPDSSFCSLYEHPHFFSEALVFNK
nr:cardiac phospholamban isoform X2 [Geotrypetes seraphini]